MFVLAVAWEFWLEKAAFQLINGGYDTEFETAERWRFIATSVSFGALALIGPLVLLRKAIVKLQQAIRLAHRATDEAIRASEAKSQFLATMGHELRTPLNAVIGFSEVLSSGMHGPLQPKYAEYAEDIHQSGIRLLRVINDILDFSNAMAGRLSLEIADLDVERVIRSLVPQLSSLSASAGVALNIEAGPSSVSICADAARLQQVLVHLVSNGIKFTPSGGAVTVRVRVRDHRAGIEISDTGIGMAPGDIPKAMTPFAQIDSTLARSYEGAGLGLPMAKLLTELMGGGFELASSLGAGMTVTVTFPLSAAKAQSIQDVAA